MGKFLFLEHTADIRMRVSGKTIRELFETAAIGMASLIKRKICQKKGKLDIKGEVNISSINQTALLIDFLSEILAQANFNRAVFCKFAFKKLTPDQVWVKMRGKRVSSFDCDIKAVTYHQANIFKNKKGKWETIIVFDI